MRRVLVTVACAAVLGWGSLAVRAQSDGGYRLVANWPTLPAGMFFGPADPKDKPSPPNDRIAEAAARRASGGARAGGGANANGGAAQRGGGGGGRGGGTPVPLINQDITLPVSPGGAAGQAQPGISGLAIDKNDLIYVFNRGVKPVMVFNTDGKLVRSGADQEINGKKIDPSWEHSGGVDWDGNVWVIERDAHRIVKLDSTLTKFLLQLGVTNEKGTDATHLNLPSGIAILHSGNIVVTDGYGNNRVILYDRNGKFIKQVGKGAGGQADKGTGPGEWNLPHKIAVDADETLYIIDREGHRVQVFDKDLNYKREIHVPGWNPWDINISRKGTDGIAFVADHAGERVHKIQLSDGKVLATWGSMGWAPGQFDWVHGIVVDSKGAVYTADTYGQRIQKYLPPAK